MRLRVSSARSRRMSATRTRAPSRAMTMAVARPVAMPGPGVEPAPVTIATFPSTRPRRWTTRPPVRSPLRWPSYRMLTSRRTAPSIPSYRLLVLSISSSYRTLAFRSLDVSVVSVECRFAVVRKREPPPLACAALRCRSFSSSALRAPPPVHAGVLFVTAEPRRHLNEPNGPFHRLVAPSYAGVRFGALWLCDCRAQIGGAITVCAGPDRERLSQFGSDSCGTRRCLLASVTFGTPCILALSNSGSSVGNSAGAVTSGPVITYRSIARENR